MLLLDAGVAFGFGHSSSAMMMILMIVAVAASSLVPTAGAKTTVGRLDMPLSLRQRHLRGLSRAVARVYRQTDHHPCQAPE